METGRPVGRGLRLWQGEGVTRVEWAQMNLANRLTLARMLMVPLFVVLMSFPRTIFLVLAYAVFTAATVTDYYDGKIARSRNEVTSFGKLLDPVADKMLLSAAFVMLMELDVLWIPGWTVVVILAREFLITGARSLAASSGEVIGANRYGKTKAILQMVYVFVFLFLAIASDILHAYWPRYAGPYDSVVLHGSLAAIVGVAVYTSYSGVQFARHNWGLFTQAR